MKKKVLVLVILITIFGLGLITLFKNNQLSQNETSVVSPIPKFLNVSNNNQVSSMSLWLPALTNFLFGDKNLPQVGAKSALVIDINNEKILYEKNPRLRLPMASLTKIMTAIIALENKNTDAKYLVTKDDLVGEDSMGLTEGESLSLEELLYGLILNSGNDAAETIATNYPTGRNSFINAMNQKVKALGLSNTNFTNPTGLEGDGDQYTTAYDLVVITKYALDKFPLFDKVAATFDHTIPATMEHKEFVMENETNLISSYPGVKGVKTGFTPEAGYCLVTYLDYQGHKLIGVILGSDNRRQEMKDLLDYSLNAEGVKPPNHS